MKNAEKVYLKIFRKKESKMSKAKETHLWFEKGDDEIQIESYTKKLK